MDDLKTDSKLIYVYGLVPSKEVKLKEVTPFNGIDQDTSYAIPYHEITAIVSQVNIKEYSQQQMDLNLKDPGWLKKKAFQHHECMAFIHKNFTVIPMSICTIFTNEENLTKMLSDNYSIFLKKLDYLQSKQEWNVKVYCNGQSQRTFVANHNPMILEFQESMLSMSSGKQYIMQKKLENLISMEVEKEQQRRWEILHQNLRGITSDWLMRKNWGKEITQRNDEMLFNCDYLVDENNVKPFLTCIQENEPIYKDFGWNFEVTGPWPPYHFSKMNKEA